MSDLDQFKSTYITECFELLEEMEEKLLELNEGGANQEDLNAIFRCAHSIKGGGGTFGFKRLVDFTHVTEYLLDALREGRISVTQDIVDALLKSVDVIKQLVVAAQNGKEFSDDLGADLAGILETMVNKTDNQMVKQCSFDKAERNEYGPSEIGMYEIEFTPKPALFSNGNEPLLIIRELKKLGNVKVSVDYTKLPELSNLDCENCYLSWIIEIETENSMEAIKEVFEFVEGECHLQIDEFGAISLLAGDNKVIHEEVADNSDKDMQEDQETNVGIEETQNKESKQMPPNNNANKAPSVNSIRVDIEKVDNLVNMVGELVITQAMIMQQTKGLAPEQFNGLIQAVSELSRHTRELQEAVMAVRMQPVKSIFSRMPRLVRDLSRQLGKDVRIEMFGENTEIDKTVIEQLSDPLTHMIRNSVDHGIEKPEEREKAGKMSQGTIKLSADNSGGRIIMEIADDGKGINREKVLKKAKEKNLVAQDVSPSDEEIDNLIFLPGFSTAESVTNVSGRGVGMDVVKRNVTQLGGTIEMKNTPGRGTKFTVSLPLTLAILDGMIVRVGTETYIVPINNIIESMCAKIGDIKRVADDNEVMNVRGEFVPILYLHNIFDVKNANEDLQKPLIVLVESGRQKIGLVVDEIIGQQQVVIKSIEDNSDPVDGVSGATILGDGNVSLILDITKLQKMTSVNILTKKVA